jgi:hypothetical protein
MINLEQVTKPQHKAFKLSLVFYENLSTNYYSFHKITTLFSIRLRPCDVDNRKIFSDSKHNPAMHVHSTLSTF